MCFVSTVCLSNYNRNGCFTIVNLILIRFMTSLTTQWLDHLIIRQQATFIQMNRYVLLILIYLLTYLTKKIFRSPHN